MKPLATALPLLVFLSGCNQAGPSSDAEFVVTGSVRGNGFIVVFYSAGEISRQESGVTIPWTGRISNVAPGTRLRLQARNTGFGEVCLKGEIRKGTRNLSSTITWCGGSGLQVDTDATF